MSFYHHVLENYILSWLKFLAYLCKSLYLSLDALWMLYTCLLDGRLRRYFLMLVSLKV
jgi:hypothetical protein